MGGRWGGVGGEDDDVFMPYIKIYSTVQVNTGAIDSFWSLLKQSIPRSLASRKNAAPNKALWVYARSFQWGWQETGQNLFAKTAAQLKNLSS